MAAIFDLHALIALQNGWRRFSGEASPTFTGTAVTVDAFNTAPVTFAEVQPHADWEMVTLSGDSSLGTVSLVAGSQTTTGFQVQYENNVVGNISYEINPNHGLLNFVRHFPMVEKPVVESWFEGLVKDSTVTFRSYASPGHDDFPLVVVQLTDEQRHTDMLGNVARQWEDGVPSQNVNALVVNQEIEVTTMTQTHELTRALFVAVRAILLRYTPMFLKSGYLDVTYMNAHELAPEEKLIAEDAGIYVRKMTWRALCQVEAYPIEDGLVIPAKKWWVLRDDIVTSTNPTPPPDRMIDVDGEVGGVVSYEE